MLTGQIDPEVIKIHDEIFGEGSYAAGLEAERAYPLRTVRIKSMSTGHMTLSHPLYDGPEVVKVLYVPATVSDAEIVRRMNFVTVLRRDKTLAFGEIKTGAILR